MRPLPARLRETFLLAAAMLGGCLIEVAFLEAPNAIGMFRKPGAIDADWLGGHALFALSTAVQVFPGYLAAAMVGILLRALPPAAIAAGSAVAIGWHLLLHFSRGEEAGASLVPLIAVPLLAGALVAASTRYASARAST